MRSFDQHAIFARLDAAIARIDVRLGACNRQPRIEMQFARTAVIIEAIGAIDVLLHLDERQAGADGMDGPRWIVEEIAGASGSPVKHRLDASVQRSSPQRVGIARLPKTDAEFGTRIDRKRTRMNSS